MKVEPLLAELNRLRKESSEDPTDPEYLALKHAFIFISLKTGEFQKYITECDQKGEFDPYKAELGQ